ncbi:NAD(P)H-hydrate dehydratase [Polaromonas eurypsychrophila]|uniref:Bifunctional NAD(P)H-hydrate repair enzyme n=1 Tax=Polaromonas eurypsychrophila TaxID=1614635 RepID=A0A916SGM7_9BURK|nr:NAD(P)H-hydrate dehydratase [Polaromonas eurypsychrophila]GGA99166.1 bifunctional NAD(P)H-hydrate repair enzyme [Polaromonas eurypsychrophila]
MQKLSTALTLPLYGVAATRRLEQQAAAALPPHTLMQRAGLAAARLTLALAPHAQQVWIACGTGNNGGDGLEAAMHLHQGGKTVTVTWLGERNERAGKLPADALASLQLARAAGVPFADTPPPDWDFAIDALLGIGGTPQASGVPTGPLDQWLHLLRSSRQPVLALDIPSGLEADRGTDIAPEFIAAHPYQERAGARFCLSFLTLKPGLFTAAGRDLAGQVWWDDLSIAALPDLTPDAWLAGQDRTGTFGRDRARHLSHKGTFGDVAIVGGASAGTSHMAGAALLAGRAALHAGAGRVFVALLGSPSLTVDPQQPELMFRSLDALDLAEQVVVCGCGGGDAVATVLPKILSRAKALVLDADGLNAVASDTSLRALLRTRAARGWHTILSPHPLEAARLLGSTTAAVQADRLDAANRVAAQFQCVVLLKGSGTVITAPGEIPVINPTGNARLATAGTGDVLAGMLGAALAAGLPAFEAACRTVFRHGQLADDWTTSHPGQVLTACLLAQDHQPDLQQQQQHQR